MKTAFVIATLSRNAGGMLPAARGLTCSLQQCTDTEVHVLGVDDEHRPADIDQWKPLVPQVFPPAGPNFFRFGKGMARAIDELAPDLMHTQDVWLYPAAATLSWSRRSKKPHLVTTHGMIGSWVIRKSRWKKFLAGHTYAYAHLRKAHCLHALNASEAQALRDFGLRNPICQIPNAIDLPDDTQLPPPTWRAKLPPEAKVLLYLGRIHPQKGLVNLIQAWSRLSQNGRTTSNWYLAIAGWGDHGFENTLRQMVDESNLASSVFFIGPQFDRDKDASYLHSDAFILPSFSEGLPMVILEAWGYSLPVVMTRESNLPIGFDRGAALRILPDTDDIAQKLDRLFSMSDTERDEIGRLGYQLVKEQFTWPQVAQDMHRVYEWVLGGGDPPDCVRLD